MATFKAVLRFPREDGLGKVYIRVSHNSQTAYIKTGKMVSATKGANKKGEVEDPYVLNYCTQKILEYTERLNRHDISKWKASQVADFCSSGDDDICFSEYARQHIGRMIMRGQQRNAKNYQLALQHLERFCGTNRVMFSQLTSTMVNQWIQSLENTKRAKEMYPVCMRQVFRAATNEYNDYDHGDIRIKTNPWLKVKIPQADGTEKIAISPEECRLFFAAPLPKSKMVDPTPELGRDVAKLILCLAGINTIDLYELRKEDYRNGCICYRRAKTRKSRADGAYIEMRVEPIIMPLIEKYRGSDKSPFLFSFRERFATADSFNACANLGIRRLCESMGIPKAEWYSCYTFRHTWGTVAQNDCEASVADVAFAMNHSHGMNVTRGYIKLDFTPAWELNAKVIDFIFFTTKASKQGMARGIEEPTGNVFRIAPKFMIYARAYFRGEILAEASDIGFSNVDEVIVKLAAMLPDTIPNGCAVQFRLKNVDTDKEAVYERTKGKGF